MSLRTLYPTFFRLPLALRKRLNRPFVWRLARRALFSSAVLATLVALIYAVENWRGHRAFAAAAREAAAIGVSFNLSDYAQPPVSDDLNLAKIPLFDAPTEPNAQGKFWSDLSARLQLRRTSAHSASFTLAYSLPDTGRPDPLTNTPADLAAFRTAVDLLSEERDHESLDAYLIRTGPLLAEVGAAAAHRPYLIYERNWDDPMSIIVPEVGTMRDLAHAASIHALVHLSAGQSPLAADTLALPLRLRTAIQREPTLLSQLTSAAMDSVTLAILWQGLATHSWTTADLDRIAPLLSDEGILKNLRHACAAETAWSVSIPLQLPKTYKGYPHVFDANHETLQALLAHWAPYGWLQQNAAASAHIHLRETLPSIDPKAGRIHLDRTPPIEERPHAAFPPYDLLTRLTQPDLRKVFKRIGQTKTNHDLARLAVALERHLLAYGTFPDSLAPALAADPALAALLDPFDGRPYRYRRDPDGGFTLWGIGQNLRDDGGTFPDPVNDPNTNRYETGDLVWRIPGRTP